jgi:hypothetical protein
MRPMRGSASLRSPRLSTGMVMAKRMGTNTRAAQKSQERNAALAVITATYAAAAKNQT